MNRAGPPGSSSFARSRRTYTRVYSVSVSYPAPTPAQQGGVGQQLARAERELAQERELGGCEMDGLSVLRHLLAPRSIVDGRRRGNDRLGLLGRAGRLRRSVAVIRASSSSMPNGLVM